MVAQDVGSAGSQDAEDAVDEPIGDGAEGLLMMMALGGHQSPVNLRQIGIDLAGRIGGEHEGALDAVVSALCDPLPWSFRTLTVRTAREQAAEAANVALRAEAIGAVEQTEQDGREAAADTGDRAQDIFRLKIGVERLDLAVQFGARGHMGVHDVDLDGDFRLQLNEIDMSAVEVAGLAGSLAQTLDENLLNDFRRLRMCVEHKASGQLEMAFCHDPATTPITDDDLCGQSTTAAKSKRCHA